MASVNSICTSSFLCVGLEREAQARSEHQPVAASILQMPHISRIGEYASSRVGPEFQTHTRVSEPFPGRIKTTTAAAEHIRGQPNGAYREAQNQVTKRLIHELAAIGGHIDVSSDAQFA